MKTRTRTDAGLTLIEVVIASIILLVVVAIVMSILYSSTVMVHKSTKSADLQFRGRELVKFCRDQFYAGRFRDPINTQTLGLYNGNTEVRYQIPVKRDDSGAMQYGYSGYVGTDPADTLAVSKYKDKTCVLRFEADTIFKESSSSPSASQISEDVAGVLPALPSLSTKTIILNMDVNKNGSKLETFVRGKIKKYILSAAGTIESTETKDDYVILRYDSATAQFNARIDPVNDPSEVDSTRQDWLFRYIDSTRATVVSPVPGSNSIGILITVWHGDYDENNKGFLIWRDRETIKFKNPQ